MLGQPERPAVSAPSGVMNRATRLVRWSQHTPPVPLLPKPDAGKPAPLTHSGPAGVRVVFGALGQQQRSQRSSENRNIHRTGLSCGDMTLKSFTVTCAWTPLSIHSQLGAVSEPEVSEKLFSILSKASKLPARWQDRTPDWLALVLPSPDVRMSKCTKAPWRW